MLSCHWRTSNQKIFLQLYKIKRTTNKTRTDSMSHTIKNGFMNEKNASKKSTKSVGKRTYSWNMTSDLLLYVFLFFCRPIFRLKNMQSCTKFTNKVWDKLRLLKNYKKSNRRPKISTKDIWTSNHQVRLRIWLKSSDAYNNKDRVWCINM